MIIKKIISKFLKQFEEKNVFVSDNAVFLTFDDGPEEGITEFVLDELERYDYKATFFCRGDNAEKNKDLLDMVRSKGHSIGNHTYSHLHAYNISTDVYLDDVNKADGILRSNLFRPPWGCLTLKLFLKLRNRFRLIYWNIESGDSCLNENQIPENFCRLKQETKSGSIVLFHFCKRHEKETQQLLPMYLRWLKDNNYISREL